MKHRGRGSLWMAAAWLLLVQCGSRSELERPGESAAAAPSDGSAPEAALADGSSPEAGSPDAPLAEASACTPAPPGGAVIESFSQQVVSMALAVAGNTTYAGTAAVGTTGPLYVGAVASTPSSGGAARPLEAPSYNFGNLATDGARLYYPQTTGKAEGQSSAIYTTIGLASVDLATGAVHPITTTAPPFSTSSNINSTMIAATSARPGVFWIGSPGSAATTLAFWDPESDSVTMFAAGANLAGLAVDSSGVYWADRGAGQGMTVYGAPLEGGQGSVLATVPGGRGGVLLGVTNTDVVFVSDYATAGIEAVSKAGGAVRHVANAASSWVNAFAWVDSPYLYWVEPNTETPLKRISVTGRAAKIVPTQGDVQSLAFDACNVYVGSINPAQVFALPK
jgi:hypothetical protein